LTGQNANTRARRDYGAFDWQYAAAGSADLANWARAVLVAEPLSRDVFAFRAAKRWPGWTGNTGDPEHVRFFRQEREPGKVYWHDASASDVAEAKAGKTEDAKDEAQLDELAESALRLVKAKPLPVLVFDAGFMRNARLSRQKMRDAKYEIIYAGKLALSRREPAPDGRKYIGTPEAIRELEGRWAAPELEGIAQ
jgi:hypothetical protein